MAVELCRRRFTVDEYHRMAAAGVLGEDDRVELIDGEIVRMTPIGARHAACVARLTRLFSSAVGERAIVWVQNPLRLSPGSEVQPDLVLLRPRADFYDRSLPEPDDVHLVVEVADTSADYDRIVKVGLYARASIGEVWLVDLPSGSVERYRGPVEGGYRLMWRVSRGDTLSLEALPDLTLSVDAVLG